MKTFLFAFYLVEGSLFAQQAMDVKNLHEQYERTQVVDKNDLRSKVTGLIIDKESKSTCTGTLIGPRHVITAAHCVYDFEDKSWSDTFIFIPGKLSKKDQRYGAYSFKRFFIQKEYVDTMSEEYDFAIVELNGNAGDKAGWAGFRSLKDEEMIESNSMTVSFSGYPGDKDYGTLWKVSCPANVAENLLYYFCDSFGGMSGSALFNTKDAENFVIGVHTFGGPEKNGGVFINSKNYSLIDAWKNSTNYPSNTVIHFNPSEK